VVSTAAASALPVWLLAFGFSRLPLKAMALGHGFLHWAYWTGRILNSRYWDCWNCSNCLCCCCPPSFIEVARVVGIQDAQTCLTWPLVLRIADSGARSRY